MSRLLARLATPAAATLGAATVAALFLAVSTQNPPGFFRDESAIAYNATTIAASGKDEHGASWPLYFSSFGDYKSPAYVYLLAAAFEVAHPSILVARVVSAVLGLAAVLLLGLLAGRIARRAEIGLVVALLAGLNAWLFEVSRLVFEVALLPLALVSFLFVLHRAEKRERWLPGDCVLIALTLALVAYSYAAGRLLAPLLALGLLLLGDRRRLPGIGVTWALFALALVPLIVYATRHPGALGARFWVTTYITSESSARDVLGEFFRSYVANLNPWDWFRQGDANGRHHVQGLGSLSAATLLLGAAGAVAALARAGREPWWRFALFGLVVSPVPASLGVDRLHTLRMVAFPLFLVLLTVPALEWLLERRKVRRAALAVILAGTFAQAGLFQWEYRHDAASRAEGFEAAYPDVLAAALAEPGPVFVHVDDHTYVHALWYARLWDSTRIVRIAPGARPPPGGVVVGAGSPCDGCRIVARQGRFVAYVAEDG